MARRDFPDREDEREAATEIRSFYGRWTGLYDVLARLPPVRSWRDRAVSELRLGATDTALEMGCGTGANRPHLRARVGPDGRVVGVDLTRPLLEVARERGRGRRDGAAVLEGDARRPPLSGRVDGLLATFVVGQFGDPAAVVDEWCDLVHPGGRVALLHFSRSDRRWAAPLNVAYRAFVWLSSPDKTAVIRGGTANRAAVHEARVRLAHQALAGRTTDYREDCLAGGYLRVASGTVSE